MQIYSIVASYEAGVAGIAVGKLVERIERFLRKNEDEENDCRKSKNDRP